MSTDLSSAAPANVELDRIVMRVLRRLMPLLLAMYVVAFLDRANVGFAQDTLQADRGLSDGAYAAGASVFFIGYAVLEVPSNVMLHRVGARWWMTRIMVTWGLVSAAMLFVAGPLSFYLLRFLLGVAEAGFFPGVILYLTYWVPSRYLARAMGLFYLGLPLALTVGGPLSGALLDRDGSLGLLGWQWMFLVEGLLAVVVGLVAWRYLVDRPQDAAWLAAPDRDRLVAALAAEDAAKQHSPRAISLALRNGRVLYFCLVYFFIQAAVYGLTFFLPTQVAEAVGKDVGWQVGLITAVPWGASVLAALASTRLADRRPGLRVPLAVGLLLASGAGIAGSALTGSATLAIAALTVAACGFVAVQPVFWTFPTAYLSGVAAAAGIGLINALGNLGGFGAPNARTWAESAFGSEAAGLLLLSTAPVIAAVLITGLRLRTSSKVASPSSGSPS